jgi:hypothetical protein
MQGWCSEKVIVAEDTNWELHLSVPYSAQINATAYFHFANKFEIL